MAQQVIRSGHLKQAQFLSSPEFREMKKLFDERFGPGAVYFRPADSGVVAVDCRDVTKNVRGGIAVPIRAGMAAEVLKAALDDYLASESEPPRPPKRELVLEARLIREAQQNALRIPGLPDNLRFIHSQWRLEPEAEGRVGFTDLLAVDLETGRLVILELKLEESVAAHDQARSYRRYFERHCGDLVPFFREVARAMGELYGCPELEGVSFAEGPVDAFVGSEDDGEMKWSQVHDLDFWTEYAKVPDAIGPQVPGESGFKARMRFHQSWYRAEVMGVPTWGRSPGPDSPREVGSMLPDGDVDNFINQQIRDVYMARDLPQRDRYRCERNMLSSQPMCFNLFGPLKADLDLATRLVSSLFPGEVERVTDVEIEWPGGRNEYLRDNTSFDAFIRYVRPDGMRAFLGIETKLTDTFSPTEHGPKPSNNYAKVVGFPGAPWDPRAHHVLHASAWNQIWRNHMLVHAIEQEDGTPGRLVIVRHYEDLAGAETIRRYRALLRSEESFLDLPLNELVGIWKRAVPSGGQREWLSAVETRYVDMSGSERAWAALKAGLVPKQET